MKKLIALFVITAGFAVTIFSCMPEKTENATTVADTTKVDSAKVDSTVKVVPVADTTKK